jgi:hypothetical protein
MDTNILVNLFIDVPAVLWSLRLIGAAVAYMEANVRPVSLKWSRVVPSFLAPLGLLISDRYFSYQENVPATWRWLFLLLFAIFLITGSAFDYTDSESESKLLNLMPRAIALFGFLAFLIIVVT